MDRRPIDPADFPEIPFTTEFIEGNYLKRHFFGEVSEALANQKLRGWMCDPRIFYDFYYAYAKMDNPLRRMLDKASKDVRENLLSYFKARDNADRAHERARDAFKAYQKTAKSAALPPELMNCLPRVEKPKKPTFRLPYPDLSEFLGPATCEYLKCYFSKIDSKAIEFSPSDFVDILHIRYIYECDLLRCDAKMASVFRNCPHLPNERLVGTLEQLPSRIDALRVERE